jgi:hypothetical protein
MNQINELEHENNKLAYENIMLQIDKAKLQADRMLIRGKLMDYIDRAERAEAKLERLQARNNEAVLEWDKMIGKYHAAKRLADRLDHALNVANQALDNRDR